MAINVSEQFIINVAQPFESRIVASNSTVRDAIVYKYDGLRVFLLDDRKTYLWNSNTSTWTLPEISGSGDVNYITKWSTTLGITISSIFSIGGKNGINTTQPNGEFQVNNESGSEQPFIISKSSGAVLGYNWYNDGSEQYFNQVSGSGALKFRDNGEIWFLVRNGGTPALVTSSGDFTNAAAVFYHNSISFTKDTVFNNTTTSLISAARIKSTNAYSGPSSPDYSWFGNTNTGIYHPGNNIIGVSVGGSQRVIINSTGILFSQNTSISGAAARVHIDNLSGASYVKFTAGLTTGVGSGDGFDIGINVQGNGVIRNNESSNLLLSFKSNDNIAHVFNSNRHIIFSNPDGVSISSVDSSHRVIRGANNSQTFSGGLVTIAQIIVPSSCFFYVEAEFTSSAIHSGNRYYRCNKILHAYSVNSSGVITSQNTGPLTNTLFDKYSSLATTYISPGAIDTITNNLVKFQQSFLTSSSGYSLASFKVSINTSI